MHLVQTRYISILIFSPIAVPSEWNIECISSLLSQCGEKFCCEVLGNKAINGRTRELSYLLFHIWQVRVLLFLMEWSELDYTINFHFAICLQSIGR